MYICDNDSSKRHEWFEDTGQTSCHVIIYSLRQIFAGVYLSLPVSIWVDDKRNPTMLYVVGIINVIVYQIIALTNLKTTGYGLFARTVARKCREMYTVYPSCENLPNHRSACIYPSWNAISVAGLHFNDMPHLSWLRYIESRRWNEFTTLEGRNS